VEIQKSKVKKLKACPPTQSGRHFHISTPSHFHIISPALFTPHKTNAPFIDFEGCPKGRYSHPMFFCRNFLLELSAYYPIFIKQDFTFLWQSLHCYHFNQSLSKKLIMKPASFRKLLFTSALVIGGAAGLSAQNPQSPKMTATGTIGAAKVTITYSSPSVRGRKIWGDLVPYGKVWRSGANEATIIETDKELTVEGKKLPAGKYSLYTLPGEKEWQVIINSQTGQWGITRAGETTRSADKDVLVVTVKSVKSAEMQESLVYKITAKGIVLKWENLEVPVSVK